MLAKHEGKLLVVKRLSNTRWSARHDAVRALTSGYKEQIELLEEIAASEESRAEVKSDATGLVNQLCELEMSILLQMWNQILERVNQTSVILQMEGLPLNNAVHLLTSLLSFIQSLRDRFEHFESLARDESGTTTYRNEAQRSRRRKRFFDKVDDMEEDVQTEDVELSPGDLHRINNYVTIIDHLCTALRTRMEAYKSLSEKFGFLSTITKLTSKELREAAANLVQHYPEDLEDELESEIVHFASLIKQLIQANLMNVSKSFEIDMFQIEDNDLIEAFPNVNIMFKMYLCMFVSNCTGERSFSKLKLILNYLRNTMGQERLSSLALLAIENELLKGIDFNSSIIDRFAKEKACRKDF